MNIKKLFLSMAVAALSLSGFAQENKTEEPEYEFAPTWMIQLQAGGQYTLGEASFANLLSPTAALSGAYQFNPVFRMRFGVNGWQSKGGWSNGYDWVNKTNVGNVDYKFYYVGGHLDAMFNLSEVFSKWKPARKFNLYAFLGIGGDYGFNNHEAHGILYWFNNQSGYYGTPDNSRLLPYLWKEQAFINGRAGLMADWRLSDHWDLNLEANAAVTSDHFNSKRAQNPDWRFNLMAGVTYRIGKGYKEVARPVIEEVYVHDTVTVIKEVPGETVYRAENIQTVIFFQINKTNVRDTEMYKIDELVKYLNKYPEKKCALCGYADVKTGNAKINQRLSEGRVNEVARILQEKGIAADRISCDFKGDTEQPFATNELNRATICLTE